MFCLLGHGEQQDPAYSLEVGVHVNRLLQSCAYSGMIVLFSLPSD